MEETNMSSNEPTTSPVKNNKLNLSLDLRLAVLILLVVIIGMLFAWRPWSTSGAESTDRIITVSGEAKIKSEPDEYIFQPTYEFKDDSKDAALAELTKKSDEIVKKLKEIGVPDNKIKTNSDGNDYSFYYFDRQSGQNTYTLRLTVTAGDRELAQKVQDYLVTALPLGQVSPLPSFSDAKRKELESKARDEATKDARTKADQSAKNLGFKVGKVKSVEDGTNFGGFEPLPARDLAIGTTENPNAPKLGIQPGEDELTYTVKAVYFIR